MPPRSPQPPEGALTPARQGNNDPRLELVRALARQQAWEDHNAEQEQRREKAGRKRVA